MLSNRWRNVSSVLGCAFLAALCTPALAFASESTYEIEGNVAVSLQSSQAASASSAAATLAKTGDAVLWLMLGVALVGLGAVAAMRASRKTVSGVCGACGQASSSQKGLLAVVIACALAAALSFGQFAVNVAYAAEELAGVACSGQVVVDENGKVVSSSFKIANGSTASIHVKSIQAPESLNGWSATAPASTIEAGDEYAGEWSTKDVSAQLLQDLKSNGGKLTLPMKATILVTTCTVAFDTCGVDCSVDSQVVQEGDAAVVPATPASDDYDFVGWYADKDYTQAFDFAAPITSDVTLYAKWSVKGYWMAAADAQDPTAGVVKTMSQIDADIEAIKSGDSAVIDEYNTYLSDDSLHLYTRWNGSTADVTGEAQDANRYVEFRVIQVGNHDKEGCNITFQATHLLTEAAAMNSLPEGKEDSTNTGGWAAAELRASMQPGGAIYENFDSEFTDKILTVSKASSEGDLSVELTYSQNKFWLLAYSELTGVGVKDSTAYEGSQYQYWANKGITYEGGKWECLKLLTRAGNNPSGLQGGMLRWWNRSPLLNKNWPGSFAEVYCPGSTGAVGYGTISSFPLGVSLAFCF